VAARGRQGHRRTVPAAVRASSCRCGCWSAAQTRAWPSRHRGAADVAEPCDTSGDATLVSDMGSGRRQRLLARAHDRCRRKERFCDRSPIESDSSGAYFGSSSRPDVLAWAGRVAGQGRSAGRSAARNAVGLWGVRPSREVNPGRHDLCGCAVIPAVSGDSCPHSRQEPSESAPNTILSSGLPRQLRVPLTVRSRPPAGRSAPSGPSPSLPL
jgi:hypothetical protein